MYYEFKVGNETYNLRLPTKEIINLEKEIGMNPLMIFGKNGDNIPTITVMVAILFASMKQLNHGITKDKVYEIFDKYIEENSIESFGEVILEIYKVSGLIKEKN